MLRLHSIKSKFIFYLLITLIPIFTMMVYLGESYTREVLSKSALFKAKMLAFEAARKIENLTFDISVKPKEVAQLVGYHIAILDKVEQLMRQDVKQSRFIYGMALAFIPKYSPDKNYFCRYFYKRGNKLYDKQLLPPSYDYTKFDWFTKPLKLNKDVWSVPYFDKGGGEVWMSTFSAVIRDPSGNIVGVATADVSISFLSKIIKQISILKTGGAFLFTTNGSILAPVGNSKAVNKSVSKIFQSFDKGNLKKLAYNVLKKKQNYSKIRVENEEYLVFYTPVRNTNWIIGVTFPKSELFLPIRHMEIYLFIIIVAGLFAIVVLVIIISKQTTKDIQKIKNISSQIAKGNFSVDIPTDLADESRDVAEALNIMQKSLRKFIKDVKEKAKIENELELARKIQSSFVPNRLKISVNEIEFNGISLWAKQVGGDFYGVNKIDKERVVFYIGDVSGKGVPAVLYVAMIKSMVEVLIRQTHSIKSIISFLNNHFSSISEQNSFATMFIGLIDKGRGVLEFCNAGHMPPLMFKDKTLFTPLLSGNIPVGAFGEFDYKIQTVKLNRIDGMFLYTDGATDALNSKKEQFTEKRLFEAIDKCLKQNENIIDSLKRQLTEFIGKEELYDDTTLLTIENISTSKKSSRFFKITV